MTTYDEMSSVRKLLAETTLERDYFIRQLAAMKQERDTLRSELESLKIQTEVATDALSAL